MPKPCNNAHTLFRFRVWHFEPANAIPPDAIQRCFYRNWYTSMCKSLMHLRSPPFLATAPFSICCRPFRCIPTSLQAVCVCVCVCFAEACRSISIRKIAHEDGRENRKDIVDFKSAQADHILYKVFFCGRLLASDIENWKNMIFSFCCQYRTSSPIENSLSLGRDFTDAAVHMVHTRLWSTHTQEQIIEWLLRSFSFRWWTLHLQ